MLLSNSAAKRPRRNWRRANPGSSIRPPRSPQQYQQRREGVRRRAEPEAIELAKKSNGGEFNDTNYIFLTFVTRYLPAGIVGLIIATIIGAAMSSVSSEINSLATVTVIDIYKRHFRKDASDRHYLRGGENRHGILGPLCGYNGRARKKSRLLD